MKKMKKIFNKCFPDNSRTREFKIRKIKNFFNNFCIEISKSRELQKRLNLNPKINLQLIKKLYNKYHIDLSKVRESQRKIYQNKDKIGLAVLTDDIEAEITYLLIREFKPLNVVEISPSHGWSSMWILNALKDNNRGKLFSFDLIDKSTKIIPKELSSNRWVFIQGDIKKNLSKLPKKIDYLFIDSDHSARFCRWYIKNIFSLLKKNTPVSIHDILHFKDHCQFGEIRTIFSWLYKNRISYFSPSPFYKSSGNINSYEEILLLKSKLRLDKLIHYHRCNSIIFFNY